MSLGFAAHILFMKPVETSAGKYYGEINSIKYLINDDNALYYADIWNKNKPQEVVNKIISNESLWKTDLSKIDGFAQSIINNLNLLMNNKTVNIIHDLVSKNLEKESA